MNKKAFTLAEVLITLTIIGVIAAMTIPNLMQNYRKHQVEVGVKEAYSILSNAIKMSETENGNKQDWNYSLSSKAFSELYIFPYLKISRICGQTKANDNYFCFAPKNSTDNIIWLDNSKGGSSTKFYNAILSNGMSLGIMAPGWNGEFVYFYIDINGPKSGNSKVGEDVFAFMLYVGNGYNLFTAGAPYYARASSYQNYKMSDLLGTTSGGCNINGSSSVEVRAGALCAAAIAKNGWKIPDDYPVKKF